MPEENVNEFTHKQRRIEIREGPHTFELSINGYPLKVSRLADGTYHSNILTHQSFDSAEELARALAETEGELWVAAPGRIGHGPSAQTPHEPHEPHEDEHGHEH